MVGVCGATNAGQQIHIQQPPAQQPSIGLHAQRPTQNLQVRMPGNNAGLAQPRGPRPNQAWPTQPSQSDILRAQLTKKAMQVQQNQTVSTQQQKQSQLKAQVAKAAQMVQQGKQGSLLNKMEK